MVPHFNALQIKRMDGAGSTVVQAPDQEPRTGVLGSLLLIFSMESSQKEYKRDNKGEAFIDNDPLFSATAKSAFDLAEDQADEATVALKAEELAGQIKRRCLKNDTIAWPHATTAKHGRYSRTQVPKVMNKLMKLGAVTRPQEGKRGANSGRAAIYRREI
jgi:hypothetical protein